MQMNEEWRMLQKYDGGGGLCCHVCRQYHQSFCIKDTSSLECHFDIFGHLASGGWTITMKSLSVSFSLVWGTHNISDSVAQVTLLCASLLAQAHHHLTVIRRACLQSHGQFSNVSQKWRKHVDWLQYSRDMHSPISWIKSLKSLLSLNLSNGRTHIHHNQMISSLLIPGLPRQFFITVRMTPRRHFHH